jgi:hypothetical protein
MRAGLEHSGAGWQVTINAPPTDLRGFLARVGAALAAWMEEDDPAPRSEGTAAPAARRGRAF